MMIAALHMLSIHMSLKLSYPIKTSFTKCTVVRQCHSSTLRSLLVSLKTIACLCAKPLRYASYSESGAERGGVRGDSDD